MNSIRAGEALDDKSFREARQRAIFEGCKWDPQFEDVEVLARYPIILAEQEWLKLVDMAQALARETLLAEAELVARPDLHGKLGLPRPIQRALRNMARTSLPNHPLRVMRFDLHPTDEGWKLSEVNSDVPGGFIESSAWPAIVQSFHEGLHLPRDPVRELVDQAQRHVVSRSANPLVAFVHATAFTDDRQVMLYLARRFEEAGFRTALLAPDQIVWENEIPRAATQWCREQIDALFRFFPAEWLPNLPRNCHWTPFLGNSNTPLCNPGAALLTQTKRFPFVWDHLQTPMPTWRALLPETRDPRNVNDFRDPDWILKPALGRVGDSIGMVGTTPEKEHRRIRWSARLFPGHWAAQRRFQIRPIETPDGPRFACFGVYTIGTRAAGIYCRLAATPLINHRSQEAAVLIEPQSLAATQTNDILHRESA